MGFDISSFGQSIPSIDYFKREYCSYQHGRAHIKLLFELCDKDVRRDQSLKVILLDLTDDVRHPLELLLGARDPQKVNLQHQWGTD